MKKPAGIIFDLGDTILQTISYDWIPVNKKLLEFVENDTDLTPEALQEIASAINNDFEQAKIDSMLEQDIVSFYRTLFETAGLSLSISYEEAARVCWDCAVTLTPEEGIYEVLDTLEKHEIRTGILSNGSFPALFLEENLAKYDLAHRFSFIMSSADYGIRKPHPRFFNIAARKMGLSPEDIWFIGDKPQFDVKGALASGMYPVWYNPRNGQVYPEYECLEINHWQEFIRLIESLR